MNKFKWTSYSLLILFAAFIWGYSLIDALLPAREYSEMENRYLQQMPQVSFRTILDNSYMSKVETFTNDQFALRDAWITLKSLCETALGKIENNGIAYGKDDYMFEKRSTVDTVQLEKNIGSVLDFKQKFPDENITLMLIPSSDMILADKLPRGLNNLDQKPLITDIYARAEAAGIGTVNVFGAFGNYYLRSFVGFFNPTEPFYYRTDHHWTTDGARLVFEYYAGTRLENLPQKNLVPDFYGTYYSKAKLFGTKPDTILWYDIPVKSVTINGEAVDGLYDLEAFNKRDKYAAFIHSNNGVTIIESDCNTKHVDGETSRVLLFKDSFGNSFAPLLCYSYDEITVVDLRYFSETEKLVREGGFDEILILYSFPSFAQDTNISKFKM